MTIRILIADDQYLIQEGIKSILRDEAEIEVVGTAKDGIQAIALAEKLEPNIILLDIEMPRVNGIEVAKNIRELLPNTKIIMLSSHNNQKYITQSLEAGASSYLLKESFIEDLKQAIYSLSRGYSYIEAKLLNQALNRIKANNIVNSKNKKTNIKRYRKGIYIPAEATSKDLDSKTEISIKNKHGGGISKASLAPIFELSSPDDELTASLQRISANRMRSKNIYQQKRYSKRLIFFIIAIASFVLSIIL